MYAIIETGGKQYRVEEGDVIDVEKLSKTKDKKISFPNVLFIHTGSAAKTGTPHVKGWDVLGEFVQEEEVRGPKVISYKYKRRKRYRRKVGHRQNYSRIKIVGITGEKHGT